MCKTTYTTSIGWGTLFFKLYTNKSLLVWSWFLLVILLTGDSSSLSYHNKNPNIINNRNNNYINAFIFPNSNNIFHYKNGLRDNNGTPSFWDRVKRFWRGKDNSQSLNFSNEKPLDIAVPLLIVAQPPYDFLVQSSPSEIFSLFSDNAPLRVKEAAMATVTALIGTLYKYTVDATFTTTTESLNTLLNQLHMTGYMLCNAEYRLSLYEKLNNSIPQEIDNNNNNNKIQHEREYLEGGACRTDDLLTFIRQLPEAQTNSLTENASVQAIQVLKSVAQVVVQGLAANSKQQSSLHLDFVNKGGNKQFLVPISLPLITQNAVSIKQLCLWHLALGYTVRQIEARHQIQESLGQNS